MWFGGRTKDGVPTVEARQRLLPLLLVLPLLADAAPKPPPAMFVFGDSLSDVGNNNYLHDGFKYNFPPNGVDFPDGAMPTGRFSNGYNIADVLARLMGFRQSPPAYLSLKDGENVSEGISFASGGSGHLVGWCDIKILEQELKICVTMAEQTEFFRRISGGLPRELISKSVFLFTSGSNDILYFYLTHLLEPDLFIDDYIAKLISNYARQLKELYSLGARNFALINVPALGFTPIPVAVGAVEASTRDRLNSYAHKFNQALRTAMVDGLAPSLEGMRYSIGDAYAAMVQVINHSQAYGMRNTTGACCGGFRFGAQYWPPLYLSLCWPGAPYCAGRGEYLFWDVIHPTQATCEHAGEMFYAGASPFVSPINFRQLAVGEYSSASSTPDQGNGAMVPSNGARKLPWRSDSWGRVGHLEN